MAEKDEARSIMTEVKKYRGKKQENFTHTQPELQPKRLGQEETLMAGYFFRTEERHGSTDIKQNTQSEGRGKRKLPDSLCGTAWKHKVLTNLYREKAVHPELMNNHVGSRS